MTVSATDSFRAARDLLLARRTDYDSARREFAWPALGEFNWALDWFDVIAAEHPDRTGLRILSEDSDVSLSYGQLSARSAQVANWLRGLGVRRGDRVLLMLGNVAPLWEAAAFLICTHVLKPHQVGAQTEAPKNLQFAVVSIRPSAPGKTLGEYTLTDDGLIEANSPLLWIIHAAYGITDPRAVISAPQWTDEERFDIKAKVDSDQLAQYKSLSPIEKGHLLQAVLVERFGLKAHTETRDFPGYALVVMKSGAKLHQSQAAPGQDAKRSWRISERYKLDAKNATMADLCFMLLSTEAQGTVIDETHLNGLYDFSLSWSRPDPTGALTSNPEIFTAIKEQLGLQLVRRTIPEKVVVIEQISRPTPN